VTDTEPAVQTAPKASQRALIAGVLLVFMAGIGLFQGVLQLVQTDSFDNPISVGEPRFTIEGVVRDPSGFPLDNVTIMVRGGAEANATTNATGRFHLGPLPPATLTLTASHPNYSNVTLRLVLLESKSVDLRLGPAGEPPRQQDDESVSQARFISRVWAVAYLVLAGLTLAGAVLAYRRRRRRLVLAACAAGLVAALPLSLFLAPAAFVLAWRARPDFL
jgi:hypothetical protein